MKRGLVFVILLISFSLVFVGLNAEEVSAHHSVSCNNDNVIIRLSSSVNGHAEIYSETSYPGSEPFGTNPDAAEVCVDLNSIDLGFSGSRECIDDNDGDGDPDNLVLRLSATTNAHASAPGVDSGYPIEVCYGDAVCAASTNLNCGDLNNQYEGSPFGPTAILKSETNSHVSLESAHGGHWTAGDIAICCARASELVPIGQCGGQGQECCLIGDMCNSGLSCQDGTCEPANCQLTSASWDPPLTVDEGTQATLRVTGNTADDCLGETVTIQLYEQDPLPGQGDDDLGPLLTAVFSGNNFARTSWVTVHEGYELPGDDQAEFYFVSTLDSTGQIMPSNNILNVITAGEPPIGAEIIAPEHRGIYFSGVNVNFEAEDVGADEYLWEINEDPTSSTGWEEIGTAREFDYNFFDVNGGAHIRLTVSEGDVSDTTQIAVLVASSSADEEVLAFINSPEYHEVVSYQESTESVPVSYNGTDSYVVMVSGSCVVTCLSGDCPFSTNNSLSICGGGNILIPANDDLTYSNVNFRWSDNAGWSHEASGVDGASGNRHYFTQGFKIMNLIVEYLDGESVLASETSSVPFYAGQCINNGAAVVTGTGEIQQTVGDNAQSGACNLVPGGNCCPAGWTCNEDAGGVCERSENITQCSHYPDEDSCEDDIYNVWSLDPLAGVDPECGSFVNGSEVVCSCAWQTQVGNEGEENYAPERCGLNKDFRNIADGGSLYSCDYSYTESECDNGFKTVDAIANYMDLGGGLTAEEAGCVDATYTVLCGSTAIELPFFSFAHVFTSGFVVVMIYLYLFVRRK